MSEFITKNTTVIEIGCATGYYGLNFADKCKSYTGIDLVEKNIERFKEKIITAKLDNVTAEVGNALNLENITDKSFDVVMALDRSITYQNLNTSV